METIHSVYKQEIEGADLEYRGALVREIRSNPDTPVIIIIEKLEQNYRAELQRITNSYLAKHHGQKEKV